MLSSSQDHFSNSRVTNLSIMWSTDILWFTRIYIKFYLRNYYDHKFYDHMSLGSLKKTRCLNPMIYHNVLYRECLLPPCTKILVNDISWIYCVLGDIETISRCDISGRQYFEKKIAKNHQYIDDMSIYGDKSLIFFFSFIQHWRHFFAQKLKINCRFFRKESPKMSTAHFMLLWARHLAQLR